MKHSYYIFQDIRANKSNTKGQLILILFRIAHVATAHKILFLLFIPYLLFYRFFVEWVLGVELPYKLRIGQGLKLYHGQALVINKNVKIGANCTLRHCITIGNKGNLDGEGGCPVIGDNVDIGSNSCVIGDIVIGDNVKIGSGAVVVKNVPANSIAVGNPARVINNQATAEI